MERDPPVNPDHTQGLIRINPSGARVGSSCQFDVAYQKVGLRVNPQSRPDKACAD